MCSTNLQVGTRRANARSAWGVGWLDPALDFRARTFTTETMTQRQATRQEQYAMAWTSELPTPGATKRQFRDKAV